MELATYDENGAFSGDISANNPAWVLLDLLRRSGWTSDELDLASFARTASYCDESIDTTDLHRKLSHDSALPVQSGDQETA